MADPQLAQSPHNEEEIMNLVVLSSDPKNQKSNDECCDDGSFPLTISQIAANSEDKRRSPVISRSRIAARSPQLRSALPYNQEEEGLQQDDTEDNN